MPDPKTYTQEEFDAEVAGLKNKNDELLKEQRSLAAKLKGFDGVDLEALKASQTRLTELEQELKAKKDGITQEQLNKIRVEVRADLEKEYAPLKQQVETLTGENRGLKLDTVVKDLMGKNGVRAERIDALFRLSGDKFDLTADGKPMVKGSGKDVAKFITEDLSKEYTEFFAGSGSSGGGSGGSDRRPTEPGKFERSSAGVLAAIDSFSKDKSKGLPEFQGS